MPATFIEELEKGLDKATSDSGCEGNPDFIRDFLHQSITKALTLALASAPPKGDFPDDSYESGLYYARKAMRSKIEDMGFSVSDSGEVTVRV